MDQTNSRIIQLGQGNYLTLVNKNLTKEHLIEVLTKLIPKHELLKDGDNIFIDIGSVISLGDLGVEKIIAIAIIKLRVVGNDLVAELKLPNPLKYDILHSNQVTCENTQESINDIIDSISADIIKVSVGYEKVVEYGC